MLRSLNTTQRFRLCLIGMALLFGFICIVPNVRQRLHSFAPFKGIEMMGTDQEYYASRIREVMDGNIMIGDLYYADLKDDPFVQPPLPEWIQGGMGLLFGLTIGHTFLLSKFLFGALLFVSVALFAGRLLGRPWVGLLGATAALFSWFLFASPWVLVSALSGNQVAESVARFSRITNPQISIIPFFFALWAYMGWRTDGRRWQILLSGALTGLAFYAYYYTWTMLGAVFAVLTVHALLRRDIRTLKAMALLLGVIIIVALPYLVHLRTTMAHPGYEDLALRIGMVMTHQPLFGVWASVILITGLLFGRTLSGKHQAVFVALGIASFIVLNQQVLTGRALVPQHYHWYFIHPLGILTAVACIAVAWERLLKRFSFDRFLRASFAVSLLFFVYWGYVFQAHAFRAQHDVWAERQEWAETLAWLDKEEFGNVSIYAPDKLADLITVYTPADVVYAVNTSNCCLTPAERLRNVYFLQSWFNGLTPEQVAETFPTSRRDDVSRRLFGIYHRERTGAYTGISDEEIAAAVAEYKAYAASTLCEKLALQPFDILAWPSDENVPPRMTELTRKGKLLHTDGAYTLWDVRRVCSDA